MEQTNNSGDSQTKGSGDGIGQTINAVNRLAGGGFKGPLPGLKIAGQVAAQGFSAFWAANASWFLPLLIAFIAVVGFTAMIVSSTPASTFSPPTGGPTATPMPTLAP